MAIDLTIDLIRQNLAVTLLPSRYTPRHPAPVSLLPPTSSSRSSSKQNRCSSTARIHPPGPVQQVWGSMRSGGPVLRRRRRSPAAPTSHGGTSVVVAFRSDALYTRSTSSTRRWRCRQQRTDLSPLVTISEESRGVWLARRRTPCRRRRVCRRCAVNEF